VTGQKAHPIGAVAAGILLFIVGLALGAYTWELNRSEADLVEGWLATDGTVTAVFGEGPSARALVSFKTDNGDLIKFTAHPSRRPSTGDTVRVLYPPFRPTSAVVDPTGTRRARNTLMTGASIALIALGGYVTWYARRYDAAQQTG
jgi:hypothetical protein